MKRNFKRELVVRVMILAAGVLAGLLLSAAASAQEADLVLTYEECLSVAPALVDAYKMQKHDVAISQNAQIVVDNMLPLVRKGLAELSPKEQEAWLANFPDQDGAECMMVALMNGGVVPIKLAPPEPQTTF